LPARWQAGIQLSPACRRVKLRDSRQVWNRFLKFSLKPIKKAFLEHAKVKKEII
jgi:hypothetical protein